MAKRQAFTVEDLLLLRVVRDLHVSPDGSEAVVEVRAIDREKDAYRSALWLLGLRDGRVTRLTRGGDARAPRWSPDGRSIAFLSTREGRRSQVHVIARGGGEARLVARLEGGASHFAWSPDGARLVASSKVETDAPPDGDRASSRWKNRPQVATTLRRKSDGSGFLLHAVAQAFVIDVASGEARQVTEGEGDVTGPSWSPDGERLVFCRARGGPREGHVSDVWIAGADGSGARRLCAEIPSASMATWSPDGRYVVFAGAREAGNSMRGLWRVDVRDGALAPLGDPSVELASFPLSRSTPPVWSADGAALAFLSARRGVTGVDAVPLAGGGPVRIVTGDRFVTAFHAAAGAIAFASVAADDPGEVSVARWEDGDERRLTRFNDWWDRRVLPRVERRVFAMPDGDRVDGWLLTPGKDGTSPAPLLVDVHGGPHSFADFAFPYHVYWYVLCVRGWSVLALNARGSGSYGEDFARPLRGRWGELDLPQHLAAVDALQAEGVADERIAIAGKSYGGFMAAWAIGQTGRFKAAAVCAPVTNLESHFGTSDSGAYVDPYDMCGEIHERREVFRRLSPVQYAHRATTPTLILQGANDDRCPAGQSEELFAALLRTSSAPAELVLYPKGHHDLAENGRPSHRIHYHQRIVDWLVRWCDGAKGG